MTIIQRDSGHSLPAMLLVLDFNLMGSNQFYLIKCVMRLFLFLFLFTHVKVHTNRVVVVPGHGATLTHLPFYRNPSAV